MTRRGWFITATAAAAAVVWYFRSRLKFLAQALYWEYKMGHGEGRLQAGDPAPDFELQFKKSPQTLRLSSFQGDRPVALVFGSYT